MNLGKVTIQLERHDGILRAYVLQEGRKADKNLLAGRQLTDVATTKERLRNGICQRFDGCVVDFVALEGV